MDLPTIFTQLSQLDPTPLLLAILVGGAIGLERESHGRPAGLRTHIMVCLSSALLIRASQLLPAGAEATTLVERIVYDPNRIGAGIVTGIGFLGAAAVIRSGDIVRGITTGSCVWAVAVLGIVIGQGEYGLALSGAGIMLVVLIALDRMFRWVTPIIYRRLIVRGPPSQLVPVSRELLALLRERRISVQDLSGRLGIGSAPFELELRIRCRGQLQAPEVLESILELDGVVSAEWSHLSIR
ncbi:MAG: MgtC/SapB family protein [Deltaproteobacteria bacterium]|nr:MAG: MgtC/SapB family protein [Deltaproteobacteria bacterium]